ncbi:MAG: response regulator [Candidatus Aureabacteria bacterium]|nr:response regulator [Candidatus Auribacterota bacterium]
MNGLFTADDREIMVVDDEPSIRDIVCRGLRMHGFPCTAAANSREALTLIKTRLPAVIISDINMPGQGGLWLLQQVKVQYPDTAVIMLTAIGETQSAVNCLTQGADDYIVKPIHLKELALSVGRVLEKRRLVIQNKEYQHKLEILVEERTNDLMKALQQLKNSYDMTLQALVASLDAREHETGNHSQRVSMYALRLSKEMGIRSKDLHHISKGALLHDIGKIGIPDKILLKPGSLNEEEWKLMRRHPEIGYNILKNIDFLIPALGIVLNHHEHYDGKGYPKGLKGEGVPLWSRIFLVIDAFDTMTTDRPYRKAISFEKAFNEIKRCSGTQFDPNVVKCFLGILPEEWHNIRRFTLMQ